MKMNIKVGIVGLLGIALFSLCSSAQDKKTAFPAWKPAASMNVARMAHSAVVLDDNQVLVSGGEFLSTRKMLSSVEIYNPETDRWTAVADLPEARSNHYSVVLPHGKVLIVGGGKAAPIGQPSGKEVLGACWLYDVATNTYEPTASLNIPRGYVKGVKLHDGRILVAGGGGESSEKQTLATALDSVEIYDPAMGAWKLAAPMKQARFSLSLNLLNDGKVIAVGGTTANGDRIKTTEIYDPVLDTWSPGPELGVARQHHASAVLPSGAIVVVAGKDPNVAHLSSAEILDVQQGSSTATQELPFTLTIPVLDVSPKYGLVLIGGYNVQNGPTKAVFGFNEPEMSWTLIGALNQNRFGHAVSLLKDGQLLVTGGATESAEIATAERSE